MSASRARSGHARGGPERALRHRGRDERHRHALGALAAAEGGGRPVLGADRRAGPHHRPGARHPHAHGGDGLHGEGAARAHPCCAHARRRRVAPQPARGGRQSSAGRQGGAARLLRGAPGGLRREPRPLGGHRWRGARQLRDLGHRELPGGPAHRAGADLHRGGAGARDHRPHPVEPARPRGARGRSPRPVRGGRCRGAPAGRAVRALRRRDDRELLRAPPRRVRGRDARGAPGAARRGVGRRGLARRRRRRRPAHPHPRPHRQARAIGPRSTSAAATARSAGPSTPRTSSRARRCTTR